MTAVIVIIIAISSRIVLFKILMDFGSVFSDIKALKSFNYLISSLTEAPDTLDDLSLLLTSSAYY